ncbi:MAG: formyltransferase family protein [Acidovorax sp.]|nr:formyltransferase family protein [Acidovorax sp.]
MTDKTLLILGSDKISARVRASLRPDANLVVAIDRSTNIKRVLRLVRRGSLSLRLVAQMLWCELRRSAPRTDTSGESITSNGDVIKLLNAHVPRRVVLYRAGLIINRAVLATGVPIMNIHCAKVPEFGGIGSIARALREQVYEQCATLHQVTDAIDSGVVFDTEAYELDPTCSYCTNEDRAYAAGHRLLLRTLQQIETSRGALKP